MQGRTREETFLCFAWVGFIVSYEIELNACGGRECLMLPMKIIFLKDNAWRLTAKLSNLFD